MTLTRIDTTVTGTSCQGSLRGTVGFLTEGGLYIALIGTWTGPGLPARQFTFYLDAGASYDARQFQGHWLGEGPQPWCGWRAGERPPQPCYQP